MIRMLDGSDRAPGLRHIAGVEVYADSPNYGSRDPIVAFGMAGVDLSEAVKEYYRRGITVFERLNTSPYSKRIVESLGLAGAIRASPLHCNTFGEIDQFLKVTRDIAGKK